MKYGIAKQNAHKFADERKEVVQIAKANKKEDYCILFLGQKPSPNYAVVETVAPAIIAANGKPIADHCSVLDFSR